MKRQYRVRRQTVQRPDASQRWDRAYQSLLQWALQNETNSVQGANGKEEHHAGSGIRPGLDAGAGEAADH